MGVLGELFPGRKIQDTSNEAGNGQPFRLGPIDLDKGVVEVHRAVPPAEAEPAPEEEAERG